MEELFWLLYSVAIQSAERTVFDTRTSSMAPIRKLPKAPLPLKLTAGPPPVVASTTPSLKNVSVEFATLRARECQVLSFTGVLAISQAEPFQKSGTPAE